MMTTTDHIFIGIVVGLFVGLFAGFFCGISVERAVQQREAIEYGNARYNPTTGEFERIGCLSYDLEGE